MVPLRAFLVSEVSENKVGGCVRSEGLWTPSPFGNSSSRRERWDVTPALVVRRVYPRTAADLGETDTFALHKVFWHQDLGALRLYPQLHTPPLLPLGKPPRCRALGSLAQGILKASQVEDLNKSLYVTDMKYLRNSS